MCITQRKTEFGRLFVFFFFFFFLLLFYFSIFASNFFYCRFLHDSNIDIASRSLTEMWTRSSVVIYCFVLPSLSHTLSHSLSLAALSITSLFVCCTLHDLRQTRDTHRMEQDVNLWIIISNIASVCHKSCGTDQMRVSVCAVRCTMTFVTAYCCCCWYFCCFCHRMKCKCVWASREIDQCGFAMCMYNSIELNFTSKWIYNHFGILEGKHNTYRNHGN